MQTRRRRNRVLLIVKRQKSIGGGLNGDGHMKQVHSAHDHLQRMFGGKFAGTAHGICPVKLRVRPIAQMRLLFEQPDQLARFARINETGTFHLPESIEDLHPLPRRPQNLRRRFTVKEGNRGGVMSIPATLVSQSPRSVRVNR